jgi:hypothetical protein
VTNLKTNNWFRTSLFLLLTIPFLFRVAFASTDNTSTIPDIQGHWAEANILAMLQNGVVTGLPNGNFMPDQPITRAEFISMLVKAYHLEGVSSSDFQDTANHWAKDAISTAQSCGIVQGITASSFAPDAFLTREQLVTLLVRASQLVSSKPTPTFNDSNLISPWAQESVAIAGGLKLIYGYPSNSFSPHNFATRAEVVAVLQNTFNLAPFTTYNSKTYDSTGTYGPSEGSTIIGGHVTIEIGDVTLQNMVIHGDLIVDKAVGEGSVTFSGVTVKGTTYINGGGTNSMFYVGGKSEVVRVNKENSPVRIVISGNAEISKLIAESSLILEESELTGSGIYGIISDNKTDGSMFLKINGLHLQRLEIQSEGVEVITDTNTIIELLIIDAATTITGNATIENAKINASGVLFDQKPLYQTVADGVLEPTYAKPIPIQEEDVYLTYLSALQPIVGTPQVAVPLTAGAYIPAEASVLYQWWKCDEIDGLYEAISGATAATYTPATYDEGLFLKVYVSGYGYYAGYVISNASAAVAALDTSLADNAAISAAKVALEELPTIFLFKEHDLNVVVKAQTLLHEFPEADGVLVSMSSTNTNANFGPDGEVLDLETVDLGTVKLQLSKGMGTAATATASVTQDTLLMSEPLRYPNLTTFDYSSIFKGGDQFVTIGQNGTIMHSYDGTNWLTSRDLGTDFLRDVLWNGNQFVAVGDKGLILTSFDAVTWKSNSSFTTETIRALASNGAFLVAVGNKGLVLTAEGKNLGFGERWYKKATAITTDFYDVTWTGNLFVAVGANGLIMTSPDANTWTHRISGTTKTLNKVIQQAGKLIVGGDGGTILYSENAIDWISASSGTTYKITDICWGDDQFVAVGYGENPGIILTSPDGLTWTKILDGFVNGFFTGISWNGKTYVLVGWNLIMTSADAVNWVELTSYDRPRDERVWAPMLTGVTYGGSRYVSVGSWREQYDEYNTYYHGFLHTSTNLIDWFRASLTGYTKTPYWQLYDVTRSDTLFVAVGKNGLIYTSVDVSSWVYEEFSTLIGSADPTIDLYAVTWGNGQFVTVGDEGGIRTSPDGKNWSKQTSGTTEALRDVIWNGSQYVAVGDNGTILTSSNGVAWVLQVSGVTEHLEAITWNGSVWVAVGGSYPLKGVILSSSDGVLWTNNSPATIKWMKSVCWNGQQFMVAGTGSYIYTSTDGSTWTNKLSSVGTISDLIWDGKQYVVAGWNRNLRFSTDGSRWSAPR